VTKQDAGTSLPVLPLPTHPNTRNDPATDAGRITHRATLLWANLFNIRYRILLTELTLVLSESAGENTDGNGLATREALVGRAIHREMKSPFGISGLALLSLRSPGCPWRRPCRRVRDRAARPSLSRRDARSATGPSQGRVPAPSTEKVETSVLAS
jgi:hypothetical protein